MWEHSGRELWSGRRESNEARLPRPTGQFHPIGISPGIRRRRCCPATTVRRKSPAPEAAPGYLGRFCIAHSAVVILPRLPDWPSGARQIDALSAVPEPLRPAYALHTLFVPAAMIPPDQILLRKQSLCRVLDMSASGLDKLLAKDPSFPRPLKHGETRQSAAYFVAEEVRQWVADQAARRDDGQPGSGPH